MGREEDVASFAAWLRDNGAVFPLLNLRAEDGTSFDVGVYSTSPVLLDTIIAEIPSNIVLGVAANAKSSELVTLLQYIDGASDTDHQWFSHILVPLLCLLYAKYDENENHFWSPYILMLPEASTLSCTSYFSEIELLYLESSRRATRLHNLTSNVIKIIGEDMNLLHSTFPDLITTMMKSEDEIRWAVSIIFSRAWKFDEGGFWCLLPLMDLFNHSFSIEPCNYDNPQVQEETYITRTRHEAATNEQLFVRYGCEDNAQLLVLYGFVNFDSGDYRDTIVELDLYFLLDRHSLLALGTEGFDYFIEDDHLSTTWTISSFSFLDEDLLQCLRLSLMTEEEYTGWTREGTTDAPFFSLRSEISLYEYLLNTVNHHLAQYAIGELDKNELNFNMRNIIALQTAEITLLSGVITQKLEDIIDTLQNNKVPNKKVE